MTKIADPYINFNQSVPNGTLRYIQYGPKDDEPKIEQIPAVGWICPVCGRGIAPYVSFCPCKGYLRGDIEITC